jgi:hypothetical protein
MHCFMSAGVARLGFGGLAATTVLELVNRFVSARLFAHYQEAHDYTGLSHVASIMAYTWLGLTLFSAIAAYLTGTAAAKTRALATGAAAAYGVRALSSIIRFLLIRPTRFESIQTVSNVTFVISSLASLAALVLLAIVIVHTARGAGAKLGLLVAGIGCGPIALLYLVDLAELALKPAGGTFALLLQWGGRGTMLAFAAAMGFAAVWAGRVTTPPTLASGPGPISSEYRIVASGIGVYFVGILLRIVAAVAMYATMSSAQGMDSFGSLKRVGDDVTSVGVFSAIAALVAIVGVGMIGRAPAEAGVRMGISTAIVAMGLGLLLDGITTSVTATAFTSVSGAFLAMDTLPLLAGIATGLGILGGAGLLSAFAKIADAISLPEIGERARSTRTALVIVGTIASVLQFSLKFVPVELLLVIAVVVAPGALFVAVQFIRVAVAIMTAIQTATPSYIRAETPSRGG